MSAHTPAPWRSVPWTAKERAIEATVGGKPFLVTGYALKADALLIAAAPELLKLVQDIEESLTADDTYRLLREACRELIARATGESSLRRVEG